MFNLQVKITTPQRHTPVYFRTKCPPPGFRVFSRRTRRLSKRFWVCVVSISGSSPFILPSWNCACPKTLRSFHWSANQSELTSFPLWKGGIHSIPNKSKMIQRTRTDVYRSLSVRKRDRFMKAITLSAQLSVRLSFPLFLCKLADKEASVQAFAVKVVFVMQSFVMLSRKCGLL